MPKTPVQQMLHILKDALAHINDHVETHGTESLFGKYTEQDYQQLQCEVQRFESNCILSEMHNMLPEQEDVD
jgi:hypothetical protein